MFICRLPLLGDTGRQGWVLIFLSADLVGANWENDSDDSDASDVSGVRCADVSYSVNCVIATSGPPNACCAACIVFVAIAYYQRTYCHV